jgi:hypothetical protein
MTLAAIKKMTSRLTKAQKVKLVGDLLEESMSANRVNPSYEEIEHRGNEVLSGKVKVISAVESQARIDRLMSKIKQERQAR